MTISNHRSCNSDIFIGFPPTHAQSSHLAFPIHSLPFGQDVSIASGAPPDNVVLPTLKIVNFFTKRLGRGVPLFRRSTGTPQTKGILSSFAIPGRDQIR
jgi:hypothetical protein